MKNGKTGLLVLIVVWNAKNWLRIDSRYSSQTQKVIGNIPNRKREYVYSSMKNYNDLPINVFISFSSPSQYQLLPPSQQRQQCRLLQWIRLPNLISRLSLVLIRFFHCELVWIKILQILLVLNPLNVSKKQTELRVFSSCTCSSSTLQYCKCRPCNHISWNR